MQNSEKSYYVRADVLFLGFLKSKLTTSYLQYTGMQLFMIQIRLVRAVEI